MLLGKVENVNTVCTCGVKCMLASNTVTMVIEIDYMLLLSERHLLHVVLLTVNVIYNVTSAKGERKAAPSRFTRSN